MKELYLGTQIKVNRVTDEKFFIPVDDLLRHAFICGSTGTGKTVFGKILIEEAARNGVSSVLIDLKGDISSLAIPFVNLMPDEVTPWLSAGKSDDEKMEEAREYVSNFKQKLKTFNIQPESLRQFRQNTVFSVYTPRSRKGEKFSISELYSPPDDIESYADDEPEVVAGMIQNMAVSVLSRVYPGEDPRQLMVELSFLEEILSVLWKTRADLEGIRGIETLISAIMTPPFEKIGQLNLDDYISAEKRMEIVRRLNSLLLGSQRGWFEGRAISRIIEELYSSTATKVAIFNLTELDSFSDRSLVISQLAYSIYNVFRRSHSEHLRLVFYIDEIGGSDSNAFFPPEPFYNAAKPALNLLLRQGRAFGVGMVLSTQNPGDIDYKGLTNCHSWFIGKLLTADDRKKAMEGISQAEIRIDKAEDFVRDAKEGSFLVRTRSGKVYQFQERWLYSIHKIMGGDELEELKRFSSQKQDYLTACQMLRTGDFEQAVRLFYELVHKSPSEPGNYFDLTDALFSRGRSEEALKVLDIALQNGIAAENLLVRKGEIYLSLKNQEQAMECFQKALEINPLNDQAHYQLSCIFRRKRDFENALLHINQAGRNNYQQDIYWYQKAWILFEKDSFYEAVSALEIAIKQKPDFTEYKAFRSLLLFYLGRKKEMEESVSSCAEGHYLSDFLNALISVLENSLDQAVSHLDTCLKKAPGFAPAYYEKSRILQKQQSYDKAILSVGKALELEPYEYRYWLLSGELYFSKNEFLKAETCLKKAENMRPDYRVFYLLGRISLENGRKDSAYSLFEKTLTLNPKHLHSMQLITEIQLENDPQKALETAKNFLKDNESPELLLLKSEALLKLNYTREALSGVDEYLKKNPVSEKVWFFRADILEKEGDFSALCANFRSMIKVLGDKPVYRVREITAVYESGDWDEAISLCDSALEKFPKSADLWETLEKIYLRISEEEKAAYCRKMISEIRA